MKLVDVDGECPALFLVPFTVEVLKDAVIATGVFLTGTVVAVNTIDKLNKLYDNYLNKSESSSVKKDDRTGKSKSSDQSKPKEENKKIAPNGGNAKKHGGDKHNDAIDKRIEELKNDPEVSNIRKNQTQVDKDGNKVGDNRPDIQYDKNNLHHNVEYDNNPKQMERHKQRIRQNDPNAINEYNLLK